MFKVMGVFFAFFFAATCTVTTRTAEVRSMGKPVTPAEFKAKLKSPGKITFKKHIAADWAVSRAGLINLNHPKAKAAGMKDRDEPIQIYFFEANHPTRGTFLMDSGVSEKVKTNPDDFFPSLIQSAMKMEKFKYRLTLKDWMKRSGEVKGVFLTHMHLDHILGLPDLKTGTPVYTGKGETTAKAFRNMFVQGSTDRIAGNNTKLIELKPGKIAARAGAFVPAITDFFGDGSLYVIFVPGHTPGSLAFIVRAKDGTHMITGDTCHTVWGWKNAVTPGEFTSDHKLNQKSLDWLIALSKEFPAMKVHLGHQTL